MNDHKNFQLRDPDNAPTSELVEQMLGESYGAYEILQDALPQLEMEQEWQWYTPYKAWLAKGQYFWTTTRGTRKEKNLYWLYIYEGYFSIAIWFKEKNREYILQTDVSKETKQRIQNAETMGKLPTFPVVLELSTKELLSDVYTLLECKKKLEK